MSPAPKVLFREGVSITGKACQLTATQLGFTLAVIDTGEVYAICDVPGRLAEIAFNAGALSVRHEYDMVKEHARFHR